MDVLNGAVLITGSSTGIGRATALMLARQGAAVFAGVRSEAVAEKLRGEHKNLRPLLLDVTDRDHVAAAVQTICESGVALRGVVNNAGIAVAGPLEYIPLQRVRMQFEVNVLGALAVTQAVLPLLRETAGRIVFISSVSGQIAPPFVGPYASSKFALEAMADSLRMELSRFGIAVSVVQPGNVRTPIWQKGRDAKNELMASMPPQTLAHYGEAIEGLARATEREERTGIEPEVVAAAVLRALTATSPKARYAVGNPPAWQRRMASLLPERIRDKMILRTVVGSGS